MKTQLVLPMAFYVFYIWGLGVYLFKTRLGAIVSGRVSFKYYKSFTGAQPPERELVVARHYNHQFELPLLFLVTCGVFLALDATDTLTLALAWSFVVSRLVHSWIHLGGNNVRYRVIAFFVGWLIVLGLWLQLLFVGVRGS